MLQGLRLNIGTIYELGLPSRVGQVDAAVHVGEYGKTFFFTGDFYYRFVFRVLFVTPTERKWCSESFYSSRFVLDAYVTNEFSDMMSEGGGWILVFPDPFGLTGLESPGELTRPSSYRVK